jgi:hypothetical protein
VGRRSQPATYLSDEWVKAQGLDTSTSTATLAAFERSCHWDWSHACSLSLSVPVISSQSTPRAK